MELNIFQVYFSESQRARLDFTPYDNVGRLHYTFENKIIEELAESGKLFKGDLCGVLSHAWRNKSAAAMNCTTEKIEAAASRAQVIGFHPFYEAKKLKHNPYTIGDRWHRMTPTFTEVLASLLEAIEKPHDLQARPRPAAIVYSNAWLATPEVYRKYYEDYLKPALEVIETEPLRSHLWQDVGYTKTKPPRLKLALREQIGVPYYPAHPFILERLPMVFLDQNRDIEIEHIR